MWGRLFFIDVMASSESGKYAGSEGRIHTRAPCRHCHGNKSHESQTSTPPTKGCKQPGPNNVETSVNFCPARKYGSVCGPSTVFLFKNLFAHFSRCCQRFFVRVILRIFLVDFFRTSLLHMFLTHLFRAVCCPKRFAYVAASALRNCPRDRSYDYSSIKPVTLGPTLP